MKITSLITLLLLCLATPLAAQDSDEETAAATETGALDIDIEALKKEVLSLNRDLFILEEDLLFPSNTQFSVFLCQQLDPFDGLIVLRIDCLTPAVFERVAILDPHPCRHQPPGCHDADACDDRSF